MSVFLGFLAGCLAALVASIVLHIDSLQRSLGDFIPLIVLLVFAGVWWVVYRHLEGRRPLV